MTIDNRAGLVVNLRGGHCAGKTTTLRALAGENAERVVISAANAHGKHGAKQGLLNRERDLIVFSAENTPTAAIGAVVRDALKLAGRVLFEGIRISITKQPIIDLNRSLRRDGHAYVDALLDTPQTVCFERMVARTQRTDIHEVADIHRLMPRVVAHDRDARRYFRKFESMYSIETVRIDHRRPVEALRQLLDGRTAVAAE